MRAENRCRYVPYFYDSCESAEYCVGIKYYGVGIRLCWEMDIHLCWKLRMSIDVHKIRMQSVAVCCSVLLRVAVCCRVLQAIDVRQSKTVRYSVYAVNVHADEC